MDRKQAFEASLDKQLEIVERARQFQSKGHYETSIEMLCVLLRFMPGHVMAAVELARTYCFAGQFGKSIDVCDKILIHHPGNIDARALKALTLFYLEDWPAAWKAFEVRFDLMDQRPKVTRTAADGSKLPLPVWTGASTPQRLLILGEQGLGDTIQFSQYLRPIVQRGVRVVLATDRRLFALLRSMDLDLDLRDRGVPGSVPNVDAWCPLMSLPAILGLTVSQLQAHGPYLRSEPRRREFWRQRIGSAGFKVGIVWQGNPNRVGDAQRSANLASFEPLFNVSGIRLISLQKGPGTAQIDTASFKSNIESLEPDLDSGADAFLDSAAVIENLDLVLSVDTAVAHLSAALAQKTWIILPFHGSDWRWLYRRENSVWYETVKLWRQIHPDDWVGLIESIADYLQKSVGARTDNLRELP
jgi:hypothetical protein